MNPKERERLIEEIGIGATDRLEDIESTIEALIDYLKVVRICKTTGYGFVPNPIHKPAA